MPYLKQAAIPIYYYCKNLSVYYCFESFSIIFADLYVYTKCTKGYTYIMFTTVKILEKVIAFKETGMFTEHSISKSYTSN